MLLSTLFLISNICPSLNVRDQVSHPYKTTGKVVVSYIFLFIFFDRKLEDKRFAPNNSTKSLISICSWFLQERNFDSLGLLPNVWNVPPVQRRYCLNFRCDFVLYSGLETRPFTQFSQHSILEQSAY
jgi:hypothetical protein